MKHLHPSVSSSIRHFTFVLMNGTLNVNIEGTSGEEVKLLNFDYRPFLLDDSPSAMEMLYAIFVNVLEVDDNGVVSNERKSYIRVCQYLADRYDENYHEELIFEEWEIELH